MKQCEIKTKECTKKAVGYIPRNKRTLRGEKWTCLRCFELEGKFLPLSIEKL